jgi:hypothetical protein
MVFAIAENGNGVCNRRERQWCLQSPRTPKAFTNFSPGFITLGTKSLIITNSERVGYAPSERFQRCERGCWFFPGLKQPWAEIGKRLRRSSVTCTTPSGFKRHVHDAFGVQASRHDAFGIQASRARRLRRSSVTCTTPSAFKRHVTTPSEFKRHVHDAFGVQASRHGTAFVIGLAVCQHHAAAFIRRGFQWSRGGVIRRGL